MTYRGSGLHLAGLLQLQCRPASSLQQCTKIGKVTCAFQ
ncbi:hypothetical protein CAter282_3983 [Collimonas arenae]|uniref:Uncharacterized protein n=1 Tax=Collimonas arenae TaxID=279058 RepID=A0A127QPW8_9BURK|nr:hypothetical protein CAter282_3983 [Collimonas arenae]